jgi:hypothetical protein
MKFFSRHFKNPIVVYKMLNRAIKEYSRVQFVAKYARSGKFGFWMNVFGILLSLSMFAFFLWNGIGSKAVEWHKNDIGLFNLPLNLLLIPTIAFVAFVYTLFTLHHRFDVEYVINFFKYPDVVIERKLN